MTFDELKNPELQESLKAAKTAGELTELAKEAGIELTDEQLDCIAGGDAWCGCTAYCASESKS